MSNPYFDWPAKDAADRFVPFTTVRAADVNDALDEVSAGFEMLPEPGDIWASKHNYAVATGAVNVWAAAISSDYITALVDGMQIRVKFPAANTSETPTLNLNGLGATLIVRDNGTGLDVSDITEGMVATLTYNSTYGGWQLAQAMLDGTASDISAANLAAVSGGDLIGYTPIGVTGAVPQTVRQRLSQRVSAMDFGATADGATSDNTAVLALEASSLEYVDMTGHTINTTLTGSQITKNYHNGTLKYVNSSGFPAFIKPVSPITDVEILRPRTKTPLIEWDGLKVLWLGTSIPAQGEGVDSYPELAGAAMGFEVSNLAFPGSRAKYDPADPSDQIQTVKCLSMTQDDVDAGLALYGPGSCYDDTFDVTGVTRASRMTADWRIKAQFDRVGGFGAVVVDHNRNDRLSEAGTLTPPQTDIVSVTIGSSTAINAPGHGLVVGDAVALEVEGIELLNHFAGRVQAVAGDDIVLNLDSSGYTGAFTSGTITQLDRATLYGGFEFLLHYILWCAAVYGETDCKIILCSSISDYTDGANDPHDNYSTAKMLKELADKWGLSFFDVSFEMDIKEHDHYVFTPDGVHPSTTASRQVIANHWAAWLAGGLPKTLDPRAFLPAGDDIEFVNQREALYSKWIGGFGTPSVITGADVALATLDFSTGALPVGWASTGVAPTYPAAPWDAAEDAMLCETSAVDNTSGIFRALAYSGGKYVAFDLYLPVVEGLTSSGTKTVTLARMGSGAGPATGTYHQIQLVIKEASVSMRVATIPAIGDPNTFTGVAIVLEAATKYRVRMETVKGTAAYRGAVLVYVDDVLLGELYGLDDQTRTEPTYLALGLLTSSVGADFDAYIGNVDTGSFGATDYSTRANGTIQGLDGAVSTVVNGMVTIIGAPAAAATGDTVVQATSKATGVAATKRTGQITTHAAALAAGTSVSFVLTDAAITAADMLLTEHTSGGTIGAYSINASCAAGSATIRIRNNTAGSLSEALVLRFAAHSAPIS